MNDRNIKFLFATFLNIIWLVPVHPCLADDGQEFLRFLGHGWGPGYHSFRPNCGRPMDVPPWVNSRRCVDRYSRYNFDSSAPRNCNTWGGCSNGFCNPSPQSLQPGQQFHVPLDSASNPVPLPPVVTPAPSQPTPNRTYQAIPQPNNSYVLPRQPGARNQPSPLPLNPRTNLDSNSIPTLDESTSVPFNPNRSNPGNSGTKQNPFGVPDSSRNSRPTERNQGVVPQYRSSGQNVFPVQPSRGNFSSGMPVHRSGASRDFRMNVVPNVEVAGNKYPRSYRGPRPVQQQQVSPSFQQSILRTVKPSNTFNGIR